jgi:hypothetical protein
VIVAPEPALARVEAAVDRLAVATAARGDALATLSELLQRAARESDRGI